MPRGGPREGAGRKPQVDPADRIWIGQICETLWREAIRSKEARARDQATEIVNREWNKIPRVPRPWFSLELDKDSPEPVPPPLDVRRRAEARKDFARWRGSYGFKQHSEEVEEALKEQQGTSGDIDQKAKRLYRPNVRRPKGPAKEIIRKVSRSETEKRGTFVSEATVERCWTEYRKVVRSLDDDGL
jgi:hypothetical protein